MFTNGEGGLKVGELARRFDLHPATLRYYEQIGFTVATTPHGSSSSRRPNDWA
jgi:DNA-binding transcriptional MerR regulator